MTSEIPNDVINLLWKTSFAANVILFFIPAFARDFNTFSNILSSIRTFRILYLAYVYPNLHTNTRMYDIHLKIIIKNHIHSFVVVFRLVLQHYNIINKTIYPLIQCYSRISVIKIIFLYKMFPTHLKTKLQYYYLFMY